MALLTFLVTGLALVTLCTAAARHRSPRSVAPRGDAPASSARRIRRAGLVAVLCGLTLPVLIAQAASAAPPGVSPSSGPATGGTTVTITGTGFSTAAGRTRIKFGTVDATNVSCASTTTCVANAPAGNGTVTVTAAVGNVNAPLNAGNLFSYAPVVTRISPTSGAAAGGNTVGVDGSGFAPVAGGNVVSFGAVNATVTGTCSTTHCNVVAPAGTGVVDVRVTTITGGGPLTSAVTAADRYTYNGGVGVPAVPSVLSLSPTSGRASGGTVVTIGGGNFSVTTGATTVRFGATAATNVLCSTTSTCTVTSPAGGGTVDVFVTVSGQTSVASAASKFTYTPAPAVTSVAPTSGSNVGGTAVTVNGTGFSTAVGGTTIKFGTLTASVAGGACVSAIRCDVASPASPTNGAVNVTATVDAQTSAPGPASTFTYNAPTPGPVVTALTLLNDTISPPKVRAGTNFQLVITGSNFTNPSQVQIGAGAPQPAICSPTSCVVTASVAATGVVDVVVIANGQTSTTSAATKLTVASATPTAPTGAHIIIAFPQRDFVSTDQFAAADGPYTIDVIRNGTVVGRSAGLLPDTAGLMEVNHPGGGCWGTAPFANTPDLAAGDIVRVIDRWGIAEQTTVQNVTSGVAVQPVAAGTIGGTFKIVVRGSAVAAGGGQIPIGEIEHRFVVNDPKARFLFSGRRTMRANNAPRVGDGLLAYDSPTSTNWTATYDNVQGIDKDLILSDVESRGIWLGVAAAGNESTIYEVGAAVAAGPQAPCTAPIEADVIAPTNPTNVVAVVQAAPNLDNVDVTWVASTDNRQLAGYVVWRDGAVLATVGAGVLSYSDLHVSAGNHTYEVQAIDASSNFSARVAAPPVTTQAALQPDLAISLTHTPAGDLTVGSNATYRATVTNVGQFAFNGTITVTMPLPAGLTLVSTANAGSGSPFTCSTTAPVTCTTTDTIGLSHNNDKIVDVAVAVGSAAVPQVTTNATLTSTPSVSGNGDSTAANDSASDTALVNGAPVTVVNDPPSTNPNRGLISFPARDFVHGEGFTATDRVTVQILRKLNGTWTVIAESRGNIPGADGIVEINHPGGGCWGGDPQHPNGGAGNFPFTPNIQPGDKLRYITQNGVADQTDVMNMKVDRPFSPAPGVIVVRLSAQNLDGTPMNIANFEQRLIAGRGVGLFEFNGGRRALRAGGAGGDGVLVQDAPGSINFTATYSGLSANDVATALASSSRAQWLGRDPLALNELTIFENDDLTAKGPSAPCVAAPDASTPIIPQPDLGIASTHAGDFAVGTPATYTLNVTNNGTLATSGTVQVVDTLPVGIGFVSGGGSSGFTCSAAVRVVTCTSNSSIGAGSSVAIPLNVTVANAAVPSVSNFAEVSVNSDSNVLNNFSNDATTVAPLAVANPDLGITVSHAQDFTVGSTGETYTITVADAASAGAASATITVTDTLPNGLTFVAAGSGGGLGLWSCAAAGQVVTCTSTSAIAPGASTSFPINVSVGPVAGTSVTNTATVAVDASQTDAHLADNTDADLTNVIANVSAPTGGLHMIAFPSRDFVSLDGFTQAQGNITVRVFRNGALLATSPSITPSDDPTTAAFEGIVDVNHVGAGDCWDRTPDIQPGDQIRATDAQNRSFEITVANIRTFGFVDLGGGVVEVHGTAQDGGGNPIPLGQLQHRFIKAKGAPSFDNGRRDLRTGNDGTIAYDRPGAISWTAHYENLSAADVAGARAAESRAVWSPDLLAGNDLTIFESAVAGGEAVGGCSPLGLATPSADLGVIVTFADASGNAIIGPVAAGTPVTVTVTVTNAGPANVADATVQVTLPGDTTVAGIGSGPTEVWNIGALNAGASATKSFTVTPNGTSGQRVVTAWARTAAHDFSALDDFDAQAFTVS